MFLYGKKCLDVSPLFKSHLIPHSIYKGIFLDVTKHGHIQFILATYLYLIGILLGVD